jgi:hypothetical protein
MKGALVEPQAGAVSSTLPEQVCVALPFGPSVPSGLPAWWQTTAVVTPPVQKGGSLQGIVFVTVRLVTVLAGSRFVTVKLHVKRLPVATGLEGQVFDTCRPVVFEQAKTLGEFVMLPNTEPAPVSVPLALT